MNLDKINLYISFKEKILHIIVNLPFVSDRTHSEIQYYLGWLDGADQSNKLTGIKITRILVNT